MLICIQPGRLYYSKILPRFLNNAKGYVSDTICLLIISLMIMIKDILGIDYNGILRRFKAEYTSIFLKFSINNTN
jgi:hypothetical protein